MKLSECKAKGLILKQRKLNLKDKLSKAIGSGNYELRTQIKTAIDAIDYELFNLSALVDRRRKRVEVDVFDNLD